ncbi:hypothetical protein I79_017071 [Cricetulus griseus]|uniref:Uncharacterized protein n=1 Tax=Cricetulus griseus TaxID=10029 RepID=G3I128_CRIGR|nr:hypothetical protein I79_017071 [Cricetulus griseus]
MGFQSGYSPHFLEVGLGSPSASSARGTPGTRPIRSRPLGSRPRAPAPTSPLPSNATGLPSNAASSSPPRPSNDRLQVPIYLLFLLSAPELDAEQQQQEEERKAASGQVAQPAACLSPA